ncbi:hypothetical protein HanRHA438_Chr02g0084601 [Helianthus annuus]|nr:hypothetical protein HanRHA438_Chr02g0084601 [Helianthus annuus]
MMPITNHNPFRVFNILFHSTKNSRKSFHFAESCMMLQQRSLLYRFTFCTFHI